MEAKLEKATKMDARKEEKKEAMGIVPAPAGVHHLRARNCLSGFGHLMEDKAAAE